MTRSFPFAPAWSPHKEIFKDNVPLASGKREAAPQAASFALLYVASIDCDDLIFCFARWAGEGDPSRLREPVCPKTQRPKLADKNNYLS